MEPRFLMVRDHHKWFSRSLNRDMELLAFGHAGTPVLVFPTSMGAFFEYEDRGMVLPENERRPDLQDVAVLARRADQHSPLAHCVDDRHGPLA